MWQRRTGIMLAYPLEERRLNKWEPPYIVQPKLNGERCRAIFSSEGTLSLLSSEENIIDSVPHIYAELLEFGLKNIELDGELYNHSMPLQSIHSIVSRKKDLHSDFEAMQYHIFDLVDLSLTQLERTHLLSRRLGEGTYVKRVPFFLANSFSEVISLLDTFIEQGYEGIIVRNVNYPYLRKRSTGMMKFKPRASDHYVIVGYEEEISKDGTPKNSLGALILKSDKEQIFKVGTGSLLTRENRINMWKDKEKLIGKIAHVKYQTLTERKVPYCPVLVEVISLS